MKKTIRIFGIFALVAVIGFSMVGCKDDDDDGGVEDGIFKITGIPSEYDGKYAYFGAYIEGGLIIGCQSYNTTTDVYTLVQIANGSVSLPIWTYNSANGQYDLRYSDNVTLEHGGRIDIFNSPTMNFDNDSSIANRFWTSITFSNGGAAKTWSSGSSN